MERAREDMAETRAQTDESLDAERATTDAATDRSAAVAQRALDDLIERDRIVADERLRKFRQHADAVLARERRAMPDRDNTVALERHVADDGTKAEREGTDALLEEERQRADSIVEAERRNQAADRATVAARREETDDQLSSERNRADAAVAALGETETLLAHVRSDHTRRGDALGMVAHDLRNPLLVISLNAGKIAEVATDAKTRAAAEEMTRAAARMGRLLTDLLDVARIESGTLRITLRRHDVGALLTEVLDSYRPLFAERGMTFTAALPAHEVVARFDHDRIVQVLSNLLGNAMKFTPRGGTIDLHVERRPGEVEIVLRDSGPGIHPDALPHVFERFWQIDDDARRGLGLGLYICEKIVAAHGGRIWVESDLGHGATFRFTLPAA